MPRGSILSLCKSRFLDYSFNLSILLTFLGYRVLRIVALALAYRLHGHSLPGLPWLALELVVPLLLHKHIDTQPNTTSAEVR